MTLSTVHDVHMAINQAHRFIYFVREAGEEYTAEGIAGQGAYFASRVAPLGAVDHRVVTATFYNFHPEIVRTSMDGVWDKTTPATMQAARFRAATRVLDRVGWNPSAADVAEARAIVDPVVAGLDLAGKALAAGNAAVALPDDPRVALWQQITTIREWRGDVHIAALVANGIGPCDCVVLQVGSNRVPAAMARATRRWSNDEWAAAIARLQARGWTNDDGTLTEAGQAGREEIEALTDRLCEPIWTAVGDAGAARLAELIRPIDQAMIAADAYSIPR